jgi:hypothetical protein
MQHAWNDLPSFLVNKAFGMLAISYDKLVMMIIEYFNLS